MKNLTSLCMQMKSCSRWKGLEDALMKLDGKHCYRFLKYKELKYSKSFSPKMELIFLYVVCLLAPMIIRSAIFLMMMFLKILICAISISTGTDTYSSHILKPRNKLHLV